MQRGQSIEVVVEPDRSAFERAVGISPATRDWVGATIWTSRTAGIAGPGSASTPSSRVELDREGLAGLSALGQRVVLTHELVHVLTLPRARRVVPLWLREGLADTLAFRGSGLGAVVVTDGALQGLAVPDSASLPADADFAAGGQREAIAYAQSWVACQLVAAHVGDGGLVRLAALVDGSGPGNASGAGVGAGGPDGLSWTVQIAPRDGAAFGAPVQNAVREVLGGSPSDFEGVWRSAVRAMAAGQAVAALTTGDRGADAGGTAS